MPLPESGDAAAKRFARVEAVLDEALELPPARREAFVRSACSDDEAVGRDVLELLAAIVRSEGFLEGAATPTAAADCGAGGQQIGPWTLQARIGRGGSGDVWLGTRNDGRFEQQVAVKLLREWQPDDVPRFLREQRLLARLDHPNIARLIDAGSTPAGQPYMAMDFVCGEPVTAYSVRRGLDIDARLALFLQICEAVAYAHRHLIVHRDLKPQNILVRADGRAVLLDFGIARLLDGGLATQATRSHRLTPEYAAPEQLAGAPETTSTDVYALGLLLHELLARTPPWGKLSGRGALALMQRAVAGPPPLPSACATGDDAATLRGDLDAIVQKATRPEPEARYASVEALQRDVENHRALRPVLARGDALGYRMRRGARRHWLAATASLLFFTGLVTALTVVALAERDAARERDIAQTEAKRSKAVRDYLAHMFRDAGQQARAGAPLTAKQVLEQAASRVEAGFGDDPVAAADVLKALGELNFYIDDYLAAEPLLRRWLTYETTIADATAAADVRFTLAETLHRMGRSDEAATLLAQAQQTWLKAPARHADVLLTSRMLQSQLERQLGDVDAGIATLEKALPDRLRRSGPDHFETAVLFTNIGAAYIQAGRYAEGIQASQEAMRIWTVLQMERGNDALNTLNNLAAAHYRLDDMPAAEQAFASALALRREVYGPSAATAALMGNYARTLLKTGKAAQAAQLAEEAAAMAETHAGDASPLTLSLRMTLAEASIDTRRLEMAAGLLDALAMQEASSLPPPIAVRAETLRGRLAYARGDAVAALASLDRARLALASHGTAADSTRGDVDALQRLLAAAGAAAP